MIVDKINKYLSEAGKTIEESLRYDVEKLAGAAFQRQFMDSEVYDAKGKLWFSGIGKCVRQQAYKFHGFEKKGKEIDARAKLAFFTGDLVELTIVSLAKLAGCNVIATGLQQMRIELPITGGCVSGRPDGMLFEGKEIYLIEVKSMSSYGFEKFEKGNIDEGYMIQVNAAMEALGLSKCVFIGLNKDANVLHEIVLEKSDEVVKKARENCVLILCSTPESLPAVPKELAPNQEGFYPWQCLYCSYWGHCRPNAEKVLVKNSYKLKERTNGKNVQGQISGSGNDDRKKRLGLRKSKSDQLAAPRTS